MQGNSQLGAVMLNSISVIAFWLLIGLGIGAVIGHIFHCNSEFDRRMAELDSLIEELNESAERCAEARDRLTELTVNVYQHLKEQMK